MKRNKGQMSAEVKNELMTQASRLLLAGHSTTEVAEKVGIHRTLLWKWRKGNAAFQKIFQGLQKKITDRADDVLMKTVVGKLQCGAEKGLDYMIELLDDPEASVTVKQRAAADLMDRDERMQKKRTVTAKQTHDVIPPEILALAAATAAVLQGRPLQALPQSSDGPIIEAEVSEVGSD